MRCLKIAWLVLVCIGPVAAAAERPLKHVDVFVSGQDGYAGYRIPAIETAADGSLLAFAEARKYNLADPGGKGQEIDLVLKRSTDGGATWSAMKVIEHSGELLVARPIRPRWSIARRAACGSSISAASRAAAPTRPGRARTTC